MDDLRRRWPAAAVVPPGDTAAVAVPVRPVSPSGGAPPVATVSAASAGAAAAAAAATAAGAGAPATAARPGATRGGACAEPVGGRPRRPRRPRPWFTLAADAASVAGAPLVVAFFTAMTAGSALLIDGAGGLALGVARLAGAPRWAVATAQSAILRAWMSIYVGHMELYGRMTLAVQGDPFVPGESALVVCNHRSWTDTIVLYSLARQVGAHGDVKFFTKRSLLWFPVYGLAGVLCNVCLFIQRDMSAAAGAFSSLRTHLTGSDGDDVGGGVAATKLGGAAASRGGVGGGAAAAAAAPKPGRFPPFWLINYLEGTRLTPAKVAQSQAFATSRGLPVLSHVLLPRTKGFIASAAALRGAATAVYDVTIGYGPPPGVSATEAVGKGNGAVTPSFNSLLYTASTTPRVLRVYQRRIPMEEVPSDAAELTDWLYALYAAKDARLAHLAAHGTFEGPPVGWTRISWRRFVGCLALFWAAVAAVLWGGSAALRLLRGGGGAG